MLTLHDPYSHGVSNTSSLLIEMVKAHIGGKTHNNYKVEIPMANVGWGVLRISHLEISGHGCWRGGRFFQNKGKSSIGLAKIKLVFTKMKDPSGWRFC